MKRKTLIISIVVIIISLFSMSYTFAANNTIRNATDDVRNAVGGAENMVENAGSAIGGAVQSGINTIGNGARNVGDATENTVTAMTNDRNDNYTATRTAADTETGVSTATYRWVIIGITAVGIGVLLWSYFRQNSNNELYIDSNDR